MGIMKKKNKLITISQLRWSEHFSILETACKKNLGPCPHCGHTINLKYWERWVDQINRLEKLRWILSKYYKQEVQIIITRGYNCPERALEVSGPELGYTTQHRKCATDIVVRLKNGELVPQGIIIEFAEPLWQDGGLGKQLSHPNALHLDNRGYRARW